MNVNEEDGPDLVDGEKFVEIKFLLVNPKEHKKIKNLDYHRAWTVMEHQINYEKEIGLKGYWGLGIYELNNPVRSIRER